MIRLRKYGPLSLIIILAAIIGIFSYGHTTRIPSKLTVQPMSDGKGVFVGERQSLIDGPGEYAEQVKAVDGAWDSITLGDSYAKAGYYEEAVQAYQTAYSIGGGARAVSGFLLAQTYEKLGRYDEAISLLENMIAKRQLSEMGIRDATTMKSRLLKNKK